MPRQSTRYKKAAKSADYADIDDEKFRITLSLLAETLSEDIRDHVYRVYHDLELAARYRQLRIAPQNSNEIYRVPYGYVWMSLESVLGRVYGPNWWKMDEAINHELVRPWWVVKKI